MTQKILIVLIGCLAFQQIGFGETDDATKSLRDLFKRSDAVGNRSFNVETVTLGRRGELERKSTASSTVYLLTDKDLTVIKTGVLWYRSSAAHESAWTTIDSKTDVQLARKWKNAAARSENLATRNHNVFWFIPTVKNADYLLANFQIAAVQRKGDQVVFTLKFADAPGHSYWKGQKERGMAFSAQLAFDSATSFPLSGQVSMETNGYLRKYDVKISSPKKSVPDAVAVLPKKVAEKARKD